jgi:hypothetical protein
MIYTDEQGNKFKEWSDGAPIPYYECNKCDYTGYGFVMLDEIGINDPVRELAMCPKCEYKNLYM